MDIERELHQEYMKNFKEWEREARKERENSVNWKKLEKRCSKKQLEGIKLFVRYRLYEAAASIAGMDMYDFIKLLDKLGIARG